MCVIEKGYFSSRIISISDISIVTNTSLEVCSDVAELVIERVRNNDMSDTTSMITVIGEVVVNFTGTTDQYTCTLHIQLPSNHRRCFPSLNCSTGNFGIGVSIVINADKVSFSLYIRLLICHIVVFCYLLVVKN